MEDIAFTDRYGGRDPDPLTICSGECDGMGVYPMPLHDSTATAEERAAIDEALKHQVPENGFVFIVCPTCKGTGKRL